MLEKGGGRATSCLRHGCLTALFRHLALFWPPAFPPAVSCPFSPPCPSHTPLLLCQAVRGRFTNIPLVSALVGGLAQVHDSLGIALVDQVRGGHEGKSWVTTHMHFVLSWGSQGQLCGGFVQVHDEVGGGTCNMSHMYQNQAPVNRAAMQVSASVCHAYNLLEGTVLPVDAQSQPSSPHLSSPAHPHPFTHNRSHSFRCWRT